MLTNLVYRHYETSRRFVDSSSERSGGGCDYLMSLLSLIKLTCSIRPDCNQTQTSISFLTTHTHSPEIKFVKSEFIQDPRDHYRNIKQRNLATGLSLFMLHLCPFHWFCIAKMRSLELDVKIVQHQTLSNIFNVLYVVGLQCYSSHEGFLV